MDKKVSAIIILIGIPVSIILGVMTDVIMGIIIFSMILLTVLGYIGGIWLWKELKSSDLFKSGVPLPVKIISPLGFIVLILFTVSGFFLLYGDNASLIQAIVQQGTNLMIFIASYNVGYLISIWKPALSLENGVKHQFTIKWKLGFIVIGFIMVFIVVMIISSVLFTGMILSREILYITLSVIGTPVGWLFWEHLKETQILKGELLKNLKVLSIIFIFPIIIVSITGIFALAMSDLILFKTVLLTYLLLFQLMTAYFLGLVVEIIKE